MSLPGELERPHDAPPIVGMQPRAGRGSRSASSACAAIRPQAVDLGLPVGAAPRRRDTQLGERGAEVEARAADHERELDRRSRRAQAAGSADGHLLVEWHDADELAG